MIVARVARMSNMPSTDLAHLIIRWASGSPENRVGSSAAIIASYFEWSEVDPNFAYIKLPYRLNKGNLPLTTIPIEVLCELACNLSFSNH
jgi:hypothetical protein